MKLITIKIFLLLLLFSLLSAVPPLKFQPVISKPSSQSIRGKSSMKVLAIMIDFLTDTLKTTTGNGKFNSGYNYPDSLRIDAVQHDSAYFHNKLKFVNNYFNTVSNGKANFEKITVLPQVVTLEDQICYFNFNNDNSDFLSKRLVELHKRAWTKAKTQISTADLAEYNTFVIFHAGSGQEFSLENDETPFDIPSVYLDQQELEKYGAVDPIIKNSIILPECEWQVSDVRKNPKWHFASMHGAMVLMFAHKLGLPNLYSSKDNKSGVGRFDLMDQGSGNFLGLIPAGPSAWCKEFLGWADIKNLDDYQGNSKIPLKLNSDVFRLDIDRNEYLLLEHRRAQNVKRDTAFAYDENGEKVARFFKKDYREKIEVIKPNSTITSVSNYDYALPASGIFIWHIDKRKTTLDQIKNNKVNEDYNNRGVYLEEADGSFDIGKNYWLLDAGYGTELGWTYDTYFDTNMVWRENSNKKLYAELNDIVYSPRSFPTADNNSGIPANISIYGFSALTPKDTMFFGFKRTGFDPAFTVKNYKPDFKHLYYRDADQQFTVVHDLDSIRISQFDYDEKSRLITAFASLGKPKFAPRVNKNKIWFLYNSSQANEYDLTTGLLTNIQLPGLPVAEPVANTVLTDSGLYNLSNKVLNRNLRNFDAYAFYQTDLGGSYLFYIKQDTLYSSMLDYQMEENIQERVSFKSLSDSELKLIRKPDGSFWGLSIKQGNNISLKYFNLQNIEEVRTFEHLLNYCDADRDGKLEFVASENGKTTLRNQFGSMENSFGININSNCVMQNGLLSYEKSGQTVFVMIDSVGTLNSFTANGEIINSLKQVLPVGNSKSNNFNLVELNGSIFLSLARTDSGFIQYYRIGEGELNLENQLSGDNWNNSQDKIIGLYALANNASNQLAKNGSVYNWPNPAKGDETNFRFFLTAPAVVKVTIYDLSGNKITDLSQTFSSYGDYREIKWNLSGIASGIYLASVNLNSNGKSETYRVKVAVAK